MGQKINPIGLRLGINRTWDSRWFANKGEYGKLMQDFQKRGIAAWEDFQASRKDRPYPRPDVGPDGEGGEKQRELEEKYLSAAALKKYRS